MDGNFRLGRRRNASKEDSYKDQGIKFFFLDADMTKDACSRSEDETNSAKDCSDFQAGAAHRGSTAYDEKGVFGSFCARHEYPLAFAHIFHGERLSYADLILKEVAGRYRCTQATVFYDIACKYLKHVEKEVRQSLQLLSEKLKGLHT
jgi:hypothetical protein